MFTGSGYWDMGFPIGGHSSGYRTLQSAAYLGVSSSGHGVHMYYLIATPVTSYVRRSWLIHGLLIVT